MLKYIKTTPTLMGLQIGIVLIQLFDIVIHVATNQAEPIRIASNLIVVFAVILLASGRFNTRLRLITASAIGGYLALNLIFLALAGITNPEQGGTLRIMLFVLIGATLVLFTSIASTRAS